MYCYFTPLVKAITTWSLRWLYCPTCRLMISAVLSRSIHEGYHDLSFEMNLCRTKNAQATMHTRGYRTPCNAPPNAPKSLQTLNYIAWARNCLQIAWLARKHLSGAQHDDMAGEQKVTPRFKMGVWWSRQTRSLGGFNSLWFICAGLKVLLCTLGGVVVSNAMACNAPKSKNAVSRSTN
jgi:hypothetical protein